MVKEKDSLPSVGTVLGRKAPPDSPGRHLLLLMIAGVLATSGAVALSFAELKIWGGEAEQVVKAELELLRRQVVRSVAIARVGTEQTEERAVDRLVLGWRATMREVEADRDPTKAMRLAGLSWLLLVDSSCKATRTYGSKGPHKAPAALVTAATRLCSSRSDGTLYRRDGPYTKTGPRWRWECLHRPRRRGSATVCLDGLALLNRLRMVGLSAVFRNLPHAGLRYAVLQTRAGILAASHNVRSISKINRDPFLMARLLGTGPGTRRVTFQGGRVFEVVSVVKLGGRRKALLRLGMELGLIERSARRRGIRLLFMVSTSLVALMLILGLVVAQRRYRRLHRAHLMVGQFAATLLHQMADGVIVRDAEGGLLYANPAALRVHGPDVGMEELAADPPPFLERIDRTWEGMKDRSSPMVSEESHWTDAKEERRLLVVCSSFRWTEDEEGEVILVRDVTELKEAQAKARALERQEDLSRLSSVMAHEIRNPLNGISMLAQRLRDEFEPKAEPEEYASMTAMIADEVRRLDALVKDVLQLSRPRDLRPTHASIREAVKQVVATLVQDAASLEVQIEVEITPGESALIDQDGLRQVLLNLVKNGIVAASGGGGRVVVSSSISGDMVLIEVQDDGPGLPEGDEERVFDLFFTTRRTGTGLGLAVARDIVERSGGTLDLAPHEGGIGAVATLALPRGPGLD